MVQRTSVARSTFSTPVILFVIVLSISLIQRWLTREKT